MARPSSLGQNLRPSSSRGLHSVDWRPRPELNRGSRICSPLRHHSATWPQDGRGLYQRKGVAANALVVSFEGRRYKPASPESARLAMSTFATQRLNMIDAQVRTNDVTDPRIHAAMGEVPRERFVPTAKRALAYADVPVEVSPGRYLLDPRTFSKLLALADVRPQDKVLDVGCATGYSAAVFALLAQSVIALEEDADLVRIASELLPAVGSRAVVTQGPLNQGFKAKAPYDVIFVNGAIGTAPEMLLSQLAEGGRLVAVISEGVRSHAMRFVREQGRIGSWAGFDASVPPLVGFSKTVGFVF